MSDYKNHTAWKKSLIGDNVLGLKVDLTGDKHQQSLRLLEVLDQINSNLNLIAEALVTNALKK